MSIELLEQIEDYAKQTSQAIHLLKLQIEALEEENALLKAEQEKWQYELSQAIQKTEASESA